MTEWIALQERMSHLIRTVEELSDVVARQDNDIAMLTRRVAMLMQREAEREADSGTAAPAADQKPPHW